MMVFTFLSTKSTTEADAYYTVYLYHKAQDRDEAGKILHVFNSFGLFVSNIYTYKLYTI